MTASETRRPRPISRTQGGPPLARHAAAVALTVGLMLVFFTLADPDGAGSGDAEGPGSLPLNHAVPADASLVLLCLVLMLGAGARLVPRLKRYAPWRRELGIAMVVTASLHVAILNDFDLDVTVFVCDRFLSGCLLRTGSWAAANWVGFAALGYALALAATSNDWSQRKLGRGWKFHQQQTYTLFVLAWLHSAAFILIVRPFHGFILFDFPWLFWGVTMAAVLAQMAGYVRTVRAPRIASSRSATHQALGEESGALSMRAARWSGVVALWGVFIFGTWLLTYIPTE